MKNINHYPWFVWILLGACFSCFELEYPYLKRSSDSSDSSSTGDFRATGAVGSVQNRGPSAEIPGEDWENAPSGFGGETDTTPPITTITQGPFSVTSEVEAEFNFASDEPLVTFECSLDGAAFRPCSGPILYSALKPGEHVFAVRGTDSFDNRETVPATYTWTVDPILPVFTMIPDQKSPANNQVRFDFSSDKPVSSFECALDGNPFFACVSPQFYNDLPLGPHTFTVRVITLDGKSLEPAPYSFTVNRKLYKILVFLFDFQDLSHQVSKDVFEDLLSVDPQKKAAPGSFAHYFQEVSKGRIEIQGAVLEWKSLTGKAMDYCFLADNCPDYKTGNMVKEGVPLWQNAFDFGPFDANNDGFIDAVFIIHASCGAELQGYCPDSPIWSHQSELFWPVDTKGRNAKGKPVHVKKYVVMPEYLFKSGQEIIGATIGVYIHEFSHVMGLPDLYDTDYSSNGLGDWSVMATGVWNGDWPEMGSSPAHYDAWSKAYLNLADVVMVTANQHLDIFPVQNSEYPTIYKVWPSEKSAEYFLIENRQSIGFDQGLPGSGLLIYHIDETVIRQNLFLNSVNNTAGYPEKDNYCTSHYGVQLVQADNRFSLEKNRSYGCSADPFPGSLGIRAFTSASQPSSNTFCGESSRISITNISDPGPDLKIGLDLVMAED